jgi:SHS2 domain-containing protein
MSVTSPQPREMTMPYEYLDHMADLGLRATGATPEEALSAGAQAMLDAMADTTDIHRTRAFEQECRAADVPALFVEWLNELLYQREIHDVLFASASVTELHQEEEGAWVLRGTAEGEPLDPDRHELHTEIKGATYYGLEYECSDESCTVQCVLDV